MRVARGRRAGKGFTLIELMIALAIVGVLLVIAIPNYQDSMRKTRRSDAMAALLDLSLRQEKFRAQNGTYTTTIDAATGLNLGRTTSVDGYYNLTAEACASGTIARCYLLKAAPTGAQSSDTDCGTLSLDSTNVKAATGSLGLKCWP